MNRKRIYSILLAAIILVMNVGFSTDTFAAKSEGTVVTSQTFDVSTNGWSSYGPGKMQRVTPGAAGTDGCIYNTSEGIGFTVRHTVELVEGETYDISMYVKVEKATSFTVYATYSDNSYFMMLNNYAINYPNEWKKITFPITYSGTTSSGRKLVTEKVTFNFRLGNGQVIQPFYLDEVEIVSRNNVSKPAEEEEIVVSENKFYDVTTPDVSDIKGHWGEPTMYALVGNGVVSGYEDNTFRPNNSITRAEVLKMIVNSLKLTESDWKGSFSDIDGMEWYAKTVQTAKKIGLLDDSDKFYPNVAASRKDVALWISRAAKCKNISLDSCNLTFSDCENLSSDYKKAIAQLAKAGIVSGYDATTFKPDGEITRAEVCEMLRGVIELTDRILVVCSEDGSDDNDGTVQSPVNSLDGAKNIVRKYNDNMQYNMYVLFENGNYYMPTATEFEPEDSGTNGYSIVYGSYGGDRATLSGGKAVNNFTIYDRDKNIYRASLTENGITLADVAPRQFYVNGIKATRARSEGGLSEATEYEGNIGYRTPDVYLADFKKPEDLEFVYTYGWTNGRCGVEEIKRDGDTAVIKMNSEHDAWNWACNGVGNSRFRFPIYIENAYELLDEPGEWYIDYDDKYIYYIPQSYENLDEAECILPVGEGMIDVNGTIDENVCNIRFENINFEYVTWLEPSRLKFFKDLQGVACAGVNSSVNKMRFEDADGEYFTVDAAINVVNGNNIDFEKCNFSKLGSVGLSFTQSIKNCDITGCEIYNTANAGVNMGTYGPKWLVAEDERLISNNNTITNNYIHNIGTEYCDSIGIQIGTLKNTLVQHNEVFDISYSGIANGWGWDNYAATVSENLQIKDNYVHKINTNTYDGGPIYNVGATGGSDDNRSVISGNYMEYTMGTPGGLYLDQGSSWFYLTNNVLDHRRHPMVQGYGGEKHEVYWLDMWKYTAKNNKSSNNYATTNGLFAPYSKEYGNDIEDVIYVPDANWPDEALAIIDAAGISDEYKYLFPDKVQEIENGTDVYYVSSGDSIDLNLKALTRKGQTVDINYDDIIFSSDNDCVKINGSGIVAVSPGIGNVSFTYIMDDDIIDGSFEVCVDDKVSELEFSADDELELFIGDEYSIEVLSAKSLFGAALDIEGVELSVDGDSVTATKDNNKVALKAEKDGTTVLNVTYKTFLGDYKKQFTVKVSEYPNATDENIDAFKYYLGKELTNKKGWTGPNNLAINFIGDNVSFAVPDGVLAYKGRKFNNSVLCFDMQIDAQPGGWPSIALRCPDPDTQYSSSDCYIVTFGQNYLELQRFNSGKRNVIYGNVTESIGGIKVQTVGSKGDRVPCTFEYGKKSEIEIGMINTDEGVRIIVSVDGVRYIDCIDSEAERLEDAGYMSFYVRSGEMSLFPTVGGGE